MLKTHLKKVYFFPILILLLGLTHGGFAQNLASEATLLPSYLKKLEQSFDVKFSFTDLDINTISIETPSYSNLEDILKNLQKQTKLRIEKISTRYYAISKPSHIAICGIVLDNFEETKVNGATIEVLDSNIGLITDSEGQFSLPKVPANAILQINYLGFKPKFVAAIDLAIDGPCKKILLSLLVQELEEVIVSQFLTTGLSKNDNSNIVLNTDKFGILPGLIEPDILQTIQALPGVKSINETVSDINIRGGTNDQNLLLWDGIRVYQSGHFFGLISAFNPYLTANVTIIKNGTSAEYSDGVSGVINMQSVNTISENGFGGAGFNLISGDAYGQIPINKQFAFQFSARRSITDFLNTPTYNQFVNRIFQDSELNPSNNSTTNDDIIQTEKFYFYDFTGKLLLNINDTHKARLSFLSSNNNLNYGEYNITSGESVVSFLDQSSQSVGASLESKWTDKFSSALSSYYTRYNLDSQSIFPDPDQRLNQINQVVETAIKIKTNYQLSNELSWLNGYQTNEIGVLNFTDVSLPSFQNNSKEIIRTNAFFSEGSYKSIGEKLKIKAGVRFNFIENADTFNKTLIEPRFNLNYTFTKNINIEAKGELKNQTTNQVVDLEQNFLGIEKRRWVLSNDENLPIAQSKQASLGLNYDSPKLYIGLEGFYKEVSSVSTATQGFQNPNQFNGEIGSYDIQGVEFLINKKTNTYSTWLSYTYNINTYTFNSLIPTSFPNNLDVRHNLTFAGTYTYNDFKFSLGLNYRSGRPFTEPDAAEPINTEFFPSRINFADPNSSRLPAYLRADASATYNFDLSRTIKATVGASILNLTNRENILNTYYTINAMDEISTVENVSLGLTPNFSFRIRF